jgi:KDO2-lipid IV(A) lauroyltransferase
MIKVALFIFSILPLKLNHLVGAIIGRIMYSKNSESRKIVEKNLLLCFPDLNEDEHNELVLKNLIETGKNLSECGLIWNNSLKKNSSYITRTNGSHYLDSNEATILLVPHFGCWELTAKMVTKYKPAVFLYKKLNKESQNLLLLQQREKGQLTMASADKRGVLKLSRTLKGGGLIGILPDQDPGKDGSIDSTFFGQNARTMTLLVKLARKNNARILMAWSKRLDFGEGFELNIEPINILSKSGDAEADILMQNKVIENLVSSQPEQYLWNYKRFKPFIDY